MNNIKELEQMSGETKMKRPTRYVVTQISLNGSSGKFEKTTFSKDGVQKSELDEAELTQVTLKTRRRLFEFIGKAGTDDKRTRFSNEHDSWEDTVTVFETTKGGKMMPVIEGDYQIVRETYPGLKVHFHLYSLINGEIVKLVVKGSSLANLFRYREELETDKNIFENEVKISAVESKGPLGSYYSIDFKKGEPTDLDVIGPKIKEVDDAIKAHESFYKSKVKKPSSEPENPQDDEENKPPVEAYENDEEQTKKEFDDIPTVEVE